MYESDKSDDAVAWVKISVALIVDDEESAKAIEEELQDQVEPIDSKVAVNNQETVNIQNEATGETSQK